MANFCNQCGRPLKAGEVCTCRQEQESDGRTQELNPDMGANRSTGGNAPIMPGDGIPLKQLIGFGESGQTDVTGCFERNKQITPDLVAPCEQEVPIKQYELCSARSRLRGLWQEGRLQVTNKRILFRLSGRSWIGRAMSHIEFKIDEIAGVQISNGVRFSIWDFLFALVIGFIIQLVMKPIGYSVGILGFLVGIAGFVPCVLLRRKYFIQFVCLGASIGGFLGAARAWRASWLITFILLAFMLYFITGFLFALKPSLSISVLTKCASEAPIYIWSRQNMVSVMEILPGTDAKLAIEELGSMLLDIQSQGEAGVRKWKNAKSL